MRKIGTIIVMGAMCFNGWTQENENKFRQMYDLMATPNVYRTASGAPGHEYYQQKADYKMQITLDEEKQTLTGKETITYTNNSPDPLDYLWIQLDQNMRAKDSDSKKIESQSMDNLKSLYGMKRFLNEFPGGFHIDAVTDVSGKEMPYVINKTMMRLDLPKTLKPGEKVSFKIDWWYLINDRDEVGGRSGYEYFEEEDNYLFTIAQFFPRMAVYNDVEGWQNKQFLGRGEFTLPFGDYEVSITVPSDHIVGATGELQNMKSVMTSEQMNRYKKAQGSYDEPVMIVSPKEAEKNEKKKESGTKTWVYKAKNVRDFAFASSRKFIWDAMAVKQSSGDVMAMSYYPKEGNPLWERYSTKVAAHTLRVYTKYTFDYPYPVAISVHSKHIGMEYPMICFNGGRPEADGTYSERTKYGMLGVIIHEVGHNYFPMIVNSDERQWTWMDEGLNTFLQYLTEQEWERGYPSRRGPAYRIVDYMKGDKDYISPIMTNSESIWQFGNNAYGKPATALNILRETIMGRELFDHAFKTYANRWMFKHPTPEDFFRTMEDASAVDLDWFWRGWFYTNDHVDISLDEVQWYKISTLDPDVENPIAKAEEERIENKFIGNQRNKEDIKQTENEKYPELDDFYNSYDPYEVTDRDREKYQSQLSRLSEEEKAILKSKKNFYELSFSNIGGLVMPIILEFTFEDGSKEQHFIPAEIWRRDNYNVSKVFATDEKIVQIELDPNLETADTDRSNNFWPARQEPSRFEMYIRQNRTSKNPMQEK